MPCSGGSGSLLAIRHHQPIGGEWTQAVVGTNPGTPESSVAAAQAGSGSVRGRRETLRASSAPISASTSAQDRHRLNKDGNRQLNHALHVAAVTQAVHDTPGRVYYRRKLDEGASRKEALRALKRQISDAVYRQLVADTNR